MERRSSLPPLAAAAAVLLLGLTGAVVRQPWHDELYTLHLANEAVPDILEALRVDSGPPGHYLLCRLVFLLGGRTVFWLRLPSVIAASLAALLLVTAVHRRSPAPAGWLAAALVAFHPLVLAAAVEARGYGLLLAAAAAVAVLLGDELSPRQAVVLATVLAAACWCHSLGVVLCGGVAVAALGWTSRSRLRAWLAVAAALVSHLPWVPTMAAQPEASLVWMREGWQLLPAWRRWLLPVLDTSPVADVSLWVDLPPAPPAVVITGTLLWLAVLAGADWRAAGRVRRLLLWGSSGLALVSISEVARPVYAPGRTEILWLPVALVLATAGAARWRRWRATALLGLAGGGLWVGLSATGHWLGAAPPPESAIATALDTARPGDVVVTTGWWSLRVQHALGHRAARLQWRSWPPSAARHPGWYDDGEAAWSLEGEPDLVAELAGARGRGAGVWLVRSPGLASDGRLDHLAVSLGLVPRAVRPPLWAVWGPPPS